MSLISRFRYRDLVIMPCSAFFASQNTRKLKLLHSGIVFLEKRSENGRAVTTMGTFFNSFEQVINPFSIRFKAYKGLSFIIQLYKYGLAKEQTVSEP